MPDVTIRAQSSATPQQAWAFVEDMDNWAPFLTGYQRHTKIDDRNSTWVVKGELGGLTRIAELHVRITEWVEPQRIAFELEGVDEPFAGNGVFSIAGAAPETAPVKPQTQSFFEQLRAWFSRAVLAAIFGAKPAAAKTTETQMPQTALECSLALTAAGGSGPVMNILLAPLLPTIAQDMADKIVAALDQRATAA